MAIDQGKKVWAPDLNDGFKLGEISDFGTDTLTVQPIDGKQVLYIFVFCRKLIFFNFYT